MDAEYDWPPEFMELMIDTIPLLFRSKQSVLDFFKGAGVDQGVLRDLQSTVSEDRGSISKYEIARTVLKRINEQGDAGHAARRQVANRVKRFDDFSSCWPDDRMKARGLVATVQDLVNIKDSVTQIRLDRERQREQLRAANEQRLRQAQRTQVELAAVRDDLARLFSEQNPQKRGLELEKVLARLFKASDILVREAFTVADGNGVLEQIDGAVELDNHIYLVEMKWSKDPVGLADVNHHLSKLHYRGEARGLFISYSDYSRPAKLACKEALKDKVVVLCTLEEIILMLERGLDLRTLLREKAQAAMMDKDPSYDVLGEGVP